MPQESAFRGVLEFFVRIGIYDVILPFLLVFTIMFAILEKTKVLGTDVIDNVTVPKRNLNSLAAFAIAFFVVASEKLVAIVNQAMAQIVILVLVGISFLMLMGVFLGSEEVKLTRDEPLMIFFLIAMGLGVALIFMHAVGWLVPAWAYLRTHWSSNAVASIILFVVLFGFIAFIIKEPGSKKKSSSESE